LADTENVSAGAQRTAGKIEKYIHLVGSGSDFVETELAQLCRKCWQISDAELYFGFVGGRHGDSIGENSGAKVSRFRRFPMFLAVHWPTIQLGTSNAKL